MAPSPTSSTIADHTPPTESSNIVVQSEAIADTPRTTEMQPQLPSTAQTAEQTSPLFQLPAEMRNRIYRYALVDDSYITVFTVNHQNFTTPGLLRTCRQIRDEASGIFSETNFFALEVQDMIVRPQLKHWIWRRESGHLLIVYNSGEGKWNAIMYWLRLLHERQIDRSEMLYLHVGDETMEGPVNGAVTIVETMMDIPWGVTKTVLDSFAQSIKWASDNGAAPASTWT